MINRGKMPLLRKFLCITLTGTALFACMVGFWVICAATRELRPNSSFGAFLGSADGVAVVFAVSILFIMIAGPILQKLGFPVFRKTQ